MRMQQECLECLYVQYHRLLNCGKLQNESADKALAEFCENLKSLDLLDFTPPEVASIFYNVLQKHSGIDDLYAEEKQISTEFALAIYDEFASKLEKSENRFADTIKLVIAGNIIDYGADKDFTIEKAREYVAAALEKDIDIEQTCKLQSLMEKAERIFYVADNCGEVVFDRFLLNEYKDKITLGIRGKAVLNDVTLNEVAMSKLDEFQIVTTEDNTPGVSLKNSGKEFLYHLYNSDLVIAKGQGNYECLHTLDRPICHLLCIKCDVISDLVNVPKFQPYIEIRNC